MDRIAVIGLSLREATVDELGRLARPAAGAERLFLHELADVLGASELAFLATCNRVEIVYAREVGHLPSREDVELALTRLAVDGGDVARLAEAAHFLWGPDAAHYLFRVASSLESLVVGEDQILGQVREAHRVAAASGMVGPLLRPLFERTLQVAKEVRTRTELSRIPVSVVSLGVEAATSELARGNGAPPRVAVVGAGRMGAQIARALADAGHAPSVIVNRSVAAAHALAGPLGARAMDLEAFAAGDEPVDALFAATSAPGFVLSRDDLLRLADRTPAGRPLVAVDLAVPRDLEPLRPGDEARARRIDLEGLRRRAEENRERRADAARCAEELIERKLERWLESEARRRVDAVVADLRQTSQDLLEHALGELRVGRLAALDDDARCAVERWARGTFGRLGHLPVAALRRLAAEQAAPASAPSDAEGEPAGGSPGPVEAVGPRP